MFENSAVTDCFKNSIAAAISQQRLSHALIFEGSDEETRFAAAVEVAAALVCTGDKPPCNVCSSCLKAKSGIHPDIHILEKGEDSRIIKIEAVRDLKEKAWVLPNEGRKSVMIIREAQLMGVQAQNALLKIFEEPAEHLSFILTCQSKSALLETVISRATAYTLGHKDNSAQAQAQGRAGEKALELIRLYLKSSELDFLRATAPLIKDKALFSSVLEEMRIFFRDVVILKSSGRDIVNGDCPEVLEMRDYLTLQRAVRLVEALGELIEDVSAMANHNLTVTRFSSVLYKIKSN